MPGQQPLITLALDLAPQTTLLPFPVSNPEIRTLDCLRNSSQVHKVCDDFKIDATYSAFTLFQRLLTYLLELVPMSMKNSRRVKYRLQTQWMFEPRNSRTGVKCLSH